MVGLKVDLTAVWKAAMKAELMVAKTAVRKEVYSAESMADEMAVLKVEMKDLKDLMMVVMLAF